MKSTDTTRRSRGTGSVQQRGQSYRVRLTLPNGEVAAETVGSRDEAEALLRALRKQAREMQIRGEFDPPAEETLAKWGETWLERRDGRVSFAVKDRARWRRYVVGSPLAAIPLRRLRPVDVAGWIDAMECRASAQGRPLTVSTVTRALSLVRKALGDAVRAGKIDTNPARGVTPQGKASQAERMYLTRDELRAVVDCDAIPLRARCCYVFALYTGLRAGELWALRWGDLTTDGARPEVAVRRSHKRATTKGGKVRGVPLLPEALVALGTLRALDDFSTDSDDLVFPSDTGLQRLPDDDHGWSSRKVRGKPRVGHREIAGVRPAVMFHGLRHGCASLLVMGDLTGKPVPVAVVQRWMGHASIATTMRYAHLAPDFLHHVVVDAREAVEAPAPAAPAAAPPAPPRTTLPTTDVVSALASTGPVVMATAADVPPLFSGTLEGTRTPDRRIRNAPDNAAPQGVSAQSGQRVASTTPGGGVRDGVDGIALELLLAVDEGRPAGDAARALAVAVLATEAPGSSRWGAAVAVLEGGPLRVRRAVMLAGELLEGGACSRRRGPSHARECTRRVTQ